ncbi:MAG: PadR family transcriptional regulator [Candidatus Hodarchaeales archaeon]|jgi:DNA-binding MarR family transcriptional regulator
MLGKKIQLTSNEAFFLMILNSTSTEQQDSLGLSGAEIVSQIKLELGEEWLPSPGATYKIIKSLEKKNLIEETTIDNKEGDGRIRTYRLTMLAKDKIRLIAENLQKIIVFTNSCCPEVCCDELNLSDGKLN